MIGDNTVGNQLDPESNTPLHRQLSTMLRTQIITRSLPPGTRLPTEAQLKEQYKVSRSVVRQSLASLTAEGLIVRGRGRGSTVAPQREHHRLVQRLPGLSTQIGDEGVDVNTEVLSISREPVQVATEALGGTEVLALRRRRSVAGIPIALIHTWLPLPMCVSLTAEELIDASLHATLHDRYDITIVAGTRQIRAVPADAELTMLLRVPDREPTLLLEGTSVDENGRPVEVFRTWHRADQVVFDLDVVHAPNTRESAAIRDITDHLNAEIGPDSKRTASPANQDGVGPQGRGGSSLAKRALELSRQLAQLSADIEADR